MKRLIAFVLRFFICLTGNKYSNIRYVSRLTISSHHPVLSKVDSQYQIIITILTLCKNNLGA